MKTVNLLCVVLAALLSGCVTGSGSGSPELDAVAAEAAAMGKADLQAMIARYKGLIAEKTDVATALKAKLQEIPMAEMMGEKARTLKSDLSDTMSQIQTLKQKLAVYVDALKALRSPAGG